MWKLFILFIDIILQNKEFEINEIKGKTLILLGKELENSYINVNQ